MKSPCASTSSGHSARRPCRMPDPLPLWYRNSGCGFCCEVTGHRCGGPPPIFRCNHGHRHVGSLRSLGRSRQRPGLGKRSRGINREGPATRHAAIIARGRRPGGTHGTRSRLPFRYPGSCSRLRSTRQACQVTVRLALRNPALFLRTVPCCQRLSLAQKTAMFALGAPCGDRPMVRYLLVGWCITNAVSTAWPCPGVRTPPHLASYSPLG